MTKFKVGDVVEWIDEQGVWIIEEIIEIIDSSFSEAKNIQYEPRYKILPLWTREDMSEDNFSEGIDDEFDISTYDSDHCRISITYIKNKEFNNDLKTVIEE